MVLCLVCVHARIDLAPNNHQRSIGKVLATITAARCCDRVSFSYRQLRRFTELCEKGFDVDVVILTYHLWPTSHQPGKTEYFCRRTWSDLLITFAVFDTDGKLAARHREVFDANIGNYDYYISQEDDIDITATNFLYFRKWEKILRNHNMVPGFKMFEIPTSVISHTHLRVPVLIRPRAEVWLFQLNGTVFLKQSTYGGFYIVSNQMLSLVSNTSRWKNDKQTHPGEFNPYFQGTWLHKYSNVVIPVSDFDHSLVHHSANKYSNNIATSLLSTHWNVTMAFLSTRTSTWGSYINA